MAAQCRYEGAGTSIPQLDVVIEAAAGDHEAIGGEGDMVDLFLVAEEAGEGFDSGLFLGGQGRRGP